MAAGGRSIQFTPECKAIKGKQAASSREVEVLWLSERGIGQTGAFGRNYFAWLATPGPRFLVEELNGASSSRMGYGGARM
ncbi:hypothetical protein GobsT_33190 [Gemmata obscuriglobus]|uniref:Uncharacterized protein n=1 Tax=Gemmata obscuriglobus TaxID=114 RepID=A0A2Z3H2F9_9BACT|nr:hypothetical protein C1280_17005 [Gemmata obscuriglobus]QEG28537.1 hypothetical protein GobsT_33190 [Gemmata obscuriglobus]VTS06620.1 unnamed protein product [Gemmata obscuriglobus UQM 2246]